MQMEMLRRLLSVDLLKLNHQATSRLKMSQEQQIKFNELKTIVYNSLQMKNTIASKIQKAENVHDLLDLIQKPNLSSDEILTVMKTIMKWVNSGNENVIDIQNDKKFISMKKQIQNPDLDWYSHLSTARMIQELYRLAQEKNRNLKIIKLLVDNIVEFNSHLNKNQCSILMYSVCVLCYYDKELLEKICRNLMLLSCDYFTMNSVLKSMAIIRYKNTKFLQHMTSFFINSHDVLEKKRIINILQSYAKLGYKSEKTSALIKKFMPRLSEDLFDPDDWLNIVWSLLVLDNVLNSQVKTVLQNSFIDKLNFEDASKSLLNQIKLLNINAAAKYILKDYDGPFLDSSKISYVTSAQNKEKKLYIKALEETLTFMLNPSEYTLNLNTNMGFLLDAECRDFSYKTDIFAKKQADKDRLKKTSKKIAIMLHDYYDYCQWSTDLQGSVQLETKLLEHRGYHILPISYLQFSLCDTLNKRVKTLKRCFDLSNQV
ncbi:FAST kinase domain-containing protein 4 isoform X2 [Colletes gigas]|uniref:FAST kinase domain-containing protein 4 isoform X2 n=1 Tax=Colletes gigas TaxID=935657 RepID=UPI001C9B131F|nr:FAST kinase domain-containing protein 4 isoform X2 [Colletes gigas]